MTRQYLVMAVIGLLAAAGGYFAAMWTDPPAPIESPVPDLVPDAASVVGQRRPDFSLSGPMGQSVSISEFDGEILLLNFWATWCKPCVEEMPMLAEVQAEGGLQVIGIAVDEPERARVFADSLGLNYPLLFGVGEAMVVGRRYGNASGMLPYSVLVDADGIVRWAHLGALDRRQLERRIAEVR
jgi:peroxiredoxin